MKQLALVLVAALLMPVMTLGQQSGYQDMKSEAERYFAEGSYARAREIYLKAKPAAPTPTETRWVDFRLADTLWRAEAATQSADTTKIEEARVALEDLVRTITRIEDRDIVWAEVQESLGDFWWTRQNYRNWGGAAGFYQNALGYWAASRDIERARGRYLKIVWKMAEPPGMQPWEYYGYYGNIVSLDVLENVLKIAQSDSERARAHYLIAMTLVRSGYDQQERVPEEFEAAMKGGRQNDWYDDALYQYAVFLSDYGRTVYTEDGNWVRKQDYAAALELFRRLTREFRKGETRYYDDAMERIGQITKPSISVTVSNYFLPESPVEFTLSWRNVQSVSLKLYRVNLVEEIGFPSGQTGPDGWLDRISMAGRTPVKQWSKDVSATEAHAPGQDTIKLDEPLPLGAYLLDARSGSVGARELVLVTDTGIVLKTGGGKAVAFFANALTGAPLAGARVKVWESYYESQAGSWLWRTTERTTEQDGTVSVALAKDQYSSTVFVAAALGERQAMTQGYRSGYNQAIDQWRMYVSTDRPAYRPGEQANWKLVARTYTNDVYSTPANQTISYEITDPRGSKVADGKATLNGFGSAWGSLDLTEAMPLGEYRIRFHDDARSRYIGDAVMFRIEEYKLPEFKVSVQTPEENGVRKAFRVGEKVDVVVQAEYYFGGPVANATVEVQVSQLPYYRYWWREREFPWFYDEQPDQSSWYGSGQVVKREILKTDAEGKAKLTFDTPRQAYQDFQYRIEARVTDASRREIVANETVRVTRQRYFVNLQPDRYLVRPGDATRTEIRALDANDQPIQVEGRIEITREYWREVWLDPKGRKVGGAELDALKAKGAFPPTNADGTTSWRLASQGYERSQILSQQVRTGADGTFELPFTPDKDGYYRISWKSRDAKGPAIAAETTIWAATNRTTELGYRSGGLQIIVDKDTVRAGETARAMLVTPLPDSYVLFAVEAESIISYSVVHVTGTAKLVELPVDESYVPNVYLSAAMLSNLQFHLDTKQVVVPPVRNFLTIDVKADRDLYQPQDEGTLTVTTTDVDGKPVSAEVGLGLVDDSVYYIQQDYAGDPRQVFFGQKRGQYVQTQCSLQQKSFAARKTPVIQNVGGKDREDDGSYDERARNEVAVDQAASSQYKATAKTEGQVGGLAAAPGPATSGERFADSGRDSSLKEDKKRQTGQEQVPGEGEAAVQVRSDFRSTVLWQPSVVTDDRGLATVKVKFPDSLTSWRATARATSAGNQFGIATTTTRTRQPLTVRLQAPRFFVVGDKTTISAVINNNTDKPLAVSTALKAEGVAVEGVLVKGRVTGADSAPVTIAAGGEARVDWQVGAQQPGDVKLSVEGRGGGYADAMERTYTVYEHGVEKFLSVSGKARGDETIVTVALPKERKQGTTTLDVQISPSLAVTMLDALPYLIDYPYGCTEQTMSRFLPATIVAKTLADLGLKPEDVETRIFGGIEPSTADATHPRGKKTLGELAKMQKAGLQRLYDFQHGDGGWGWWKQGDSDHYMTAYVVWGLALARQSGVKVNEGVLANGAQYLALELVEEEDAYDMQSWMLHALSTYKKIEKDSPSEPERKAFENVYSHRDRLNAYARALLAISAKNYGFNEQASVLVRNLENGVKIDRSPDASVVVKGSGSNRPETLGTAHWGEDRISWRWSDGAIESTSFALAALMAVDPTNELIEPTMNWLVKNRRGAQWSNTRDTAYALLALTDYLNKSKELSSDLSYELYVNNTSIATKTLSASDAVSAPTRFAVDPKILRDGANEIRIVRRGGAGAIYFAAEAKFFSLEEPITPAGNEIFVKREYFKLVPHATLLAGYVYEREPLRDGDSVRSGERIETVLTIETKNDYEYLLFEDLKPAGFEAVEIRSGETLFTRELKSGAIAAEHRGDATDYTGRTQWVYQELRDRKVALFIDKLPQGVWEIKYDMRAEVPGAFHALPVMGHAMYVPEIRCNGAETRVSVVE